VLMVEPIFRAMNSVGVVSPLFRVPDKPTEHRRVLPNNSQFYKLWLDRVHTQPLKKISISLTPRGFPVNQEIIEWLAEFEEINLLAGRYEGFDNRAAELVDLELSLGNFVLNGGEVPSMALIEGVARLVPGFVGKERCTGHDSFSSSLNYYRAEEEFFIGKRRMSQFVNKHLFEYEGQVAVKEQLFDDGWWLANIAPHIENPHYTRPENWQNFVIPEFLKTGKHKLIQDWRMNWWKN
jgi:tRNA G37 N-methylase TrmD